MEIQIKSPNGVKLLTNKKYCVEDIDVIPALQDKTVTATDTAQTVSPDANYAGLKNVSVTAVPTETKTITSNGTVTPTAGKFFSSVTVNVNTAKPEETRSVEITSMEPLVINPTAEGTVMTKVTVTPGAPLADVSDATGVAADLREGVTMYGANGILQGSIADYDGSYTEITE